MSVHQKLTAIADAVRSKTNKPHKLSLHQIAEEIRNMQDGAQIAKEQWIGMLNGTLADVYVPLEVTELRDYIFYDYRRITHITLNHVTKIGAYAFAGCVNLTSTSLSDELEEIGNNAFMNTSFPEIHIPKKTRIISDYAFRNGRKMKKATFLGKPESIGIHCFYACPLLTEINVPWAEGEVAGAPWGATNATINYNYTG